MKYKALKTGSIKDKDDNVLRFWAGQIIDVTKSKFDIDFDEHPSFERPEAKDEKKDK